MSAFQIKIYYIQRNKKKSSLKEDFFRELLGNKDKLTKPVCVRTETVTKHGTTFTEPEGNHAQLHFNMKSSNFRGMRYRKDFGWLLQKYCLGRQKDASGVLEEKGRRKINI